MSTARIALIQAFLDRKYVARADDRQRSMGLAYIEAERTDLAREIDALFECLTTGAFAATERTVVDYFETAGCDVENVGLEWFLSLYDEGPSISLTSLAAELVKPSRSPRENAGGE